jgi:hypothetical protein
MRSIPPHQEPTMKRDQASLEARARRRVARKMGFFLHAFIYLAVNVGLYALNQFTGDTRWHQWPLMGWGLGLAIHGIVTFMGIYTDAMRRRMLEREMEVLRHNEAG